MVDGVTGGAEEVYRSGSTLSMEPERFKQVTVLRGPAQSFQYSSGAMGGTLELVTKDGRFPGRRRHVGGHRLRKALGDTQNELPPER